MGPAGSVTPGGGAGPPLCPADPEASAASERRESIISMLHNSNFIKISDIVSTFNVSNETARRDLDYLQDQNVVRRVYGGAVMDSPIPHTTAAIPQRSRFSNILATIGKEAAALVRPGEAVFIGPGSTALQVARHLRERSNLTVVTSSPTAKRWSPP